MGLAIQNLKIWKRKMNLRQGIFSVIIGLIQSARADCIAYSTLPDELIKLGEYLKNMQHSSQKGCTKFYTQDSAKVDTFLDDVAILVNKGRK